jgi:hypothetical protein
VRVRQHGTLSAAWIADRAESSLLCRPTGLPDRRLAGCVPPHPYTDDLKRRMRLELRRDVGCSRVPLLIFSSSAWSHANGLAPCWRSEAPSWSHAASRCVGRWCARAPEAVSRRGTWLKSLRLISSLCLARATWCRLTSQRRNGPRRNRRSDASHLRLVQLAQWSDRHGKKTFDDRLARARRESALAVPRIALHTMRSVHTVGCSPCSESDGIDPETAGWDATRLVRR